MNAQIMESIARAYRGGGEFSVAQASMSDSKRHLIVMRTIQTPDGSVVDYVPIAIETVFQELRGRFSNEELRRYLGL